MSEESPPPPAVDVTKHRIAELEEAEKKAKRAQTITYKVVADTRLMITALRAGEDFNTLVRGDVPLDSVVEWLGEGSEIKIRKTPVDREKWLKYLEKRRRT